MRVRTADAVRSLSKIRPQFALLLKPLTALSEKSISSSIDSALDIDDDKSTPFSKGMVVKQVPVDHLEVGDLIRVVSGGAASADGIVLASQSCSFDESMLTGESKPVVKSVGDTIFAGSICKSGSVDVKVDKLAGDTMCVLSFLFSKLHAY
jgi:Cu+-exporting ATPase